MKGIIKKILMFSSLVILIGASSLQAYSVFQAKRIETAYDETAIDAVQKLNLNGIELAYREYGDSGQPAIVFIHGFLGSSYDFRMLVNDFASDYHVIAFDLVGFGHSDKPFDFTYTADRHAEIVHEALDALGIATYHLVGHSMGARVALYHAHAHEETVLTLTLIAPAGTGSRDNNSTPPLFFYRYIFKNYALQRLAYRDVNHQAAYRAKAYFDPFYYFTKDIPPEILQKMRLDSADIAWDRIVDTLTVSTLIVTGAEDTWTPMMISEAYADNLDNATLVRLEATGHLPMIESPAALKEAMDDFLESN